MEHDSRGMISPAAACAGLAGTAGASDVSTEGLRAFLLAMRHQALALSAQVCVYRGMAVAAERGVSDLEEAIKHLEKRLDE